MATYWEFQKMWRRSNEDRRFAPLMCYPNQIQDPNDVWLTNVFGLQDFLVLNVMLPVLSNDKCLGASTANNHHGKSLFDNFLNHYLKESRNIQNPIIINLITIQTHVIYNIPMGAGFYLSYSYWCVGSVHFLVSLHFKNILILHAQEWTRSSLLRERAMAIDKNCPVRNIQSLPLHKHSLLPPLTKCTFLYDKQSI